MLRLRIFITFLGIIILISCSRHYNNEFMPPRENISPLNAKTIAVLPFENYTDNLNLGKFVRNSFYSHLAVRAFNDVELSSVDKTLQKFKIKKFSPQDKTFIESMGKELLSDYLVFGKVKANKKIFLALYSLNSIEIEITVVDTKLCKTVWEDNIIFEKHDGGVPTSFLSLPFISYSSGMNVKENTTFMLIENACRLLAYRIPSSLIGEEHNKKAYLLQAGAFLNRDKAISLYKKLLNKGFKVFLKREILKGKKWFKVLLGPFNNEEHANLTKEKLLKYFKIESILKQL